MSPKTIDEAINNLKKNEELYSDWKLRTSLFQELVESHYLFLNDQLRKFLNKVCTANMNSPYCYSFYIDNVKNVKFEIIDTDKITLIYFGEVDEYGIRMEIPLDRQTYKYRGNYTRISCEMLIKHLSVLQKWQIQLNKHLKADAKLQKKPVSPLHSDADDSPW